jgi:tripartite ATP-independent transporter DctP family solute receptor
MLAVNRRLVLGLAAAAALSLPALPASAQTKLKWAHVYETSEPFHTQSVWAAQEIAKRTNNRYQIDVFPASQLGKESDINQGLSLGTVDIIISGPSFAARSYPPVGVGYYPYAFRDASHLMAFAKSDVFKELSGGYSEKTGHQMLALTYYGVRHTTTNKPFKTCAEMKGLKIRVPDAPAYLATPRSCGANTTPIAFAEVYLALQNGTVDAQENPLTTIEAKKFYEVQKNIVLTGHIVDHLVTIVSKQTWSKLSDEDKKIFGAGCPGGRRPRHGRDPGQGEGADRHLQAEGLEHRRSEQGRVQGRGDEERHLRVPRLPEGRLRQDPGHEVGSHVRLPGGPPPAALSLRRGAIPSALPCSFQGLRFGLR